MRAAIFIEPGKVEAGDRPDPSIQHPTDAVVRVVLACVCGSNLWYYRGDSPFAQGGPIGHEFIGVVEDVGASVWLVDQSGARICARADTSQLPPRRQTEATACDSRKST